MDPAPARPVPVPAEAPVTSRLLLRLDVLDPEVIAELAKLPEGPERDARALAALRLGVLALRLASGEVDAAAIREAGRGLVGDMRELLATTGARLTQDVDAALKQYFDPRSGVVPQRIESLVKQDGELERVLRQHVGGSESLLARTLAEQVGRTSPLFRLLSPDEASGVKAQVEASVKAALELQREAVLREFSLDSKESALSRLVAELAASHEELGKSLETQVDAVVAEFSLDKPDSALSRLVSKVEKAQASITAEFSTDNEQSALNRLSRLLEATSRQIGGNLTLDDETSSLSRLKRELDRSIADLRERNEKFHAEVRETLGKLEKQREAEARTTLHGGTFEEQLGALLAREAQRRGDVHEAVGLTTGLIPRCKTGDFLVTMGAESAAPGARIVVEAKEAQAYTVRMALDEIDEARRNRQAQLGVFAFSRRTAPAGLAALQRHGRDVLAVWDAEDPSSDVNVVAALSVARALAVRDAQQSAEAAQALHAIEEAVRAVEKQAGYLDEVRTMADTVRSHGGKIVDRAERMKGELLRQVQQLDAQLGALKRAEST